MPIHRPSQKLTAGASRASLVDESDADRDAGDLRSVDKKVNRTRIKSAYRDAQFRPLFQALAAFEELQASGGTSVTYHTPQHPFTPTLHLRNPNPSASPLSTPSKTSVLAFPAEALTDAEEQRTARFWKAYGVALPHLRQHTLPAPWRDLSDVASLEWFHYALRAGGPSTGFTLNLSPEVGHKPGMSRTLLNGFPAGLRAA